MTKEVYISEDDLPESVASVDEPVVVEREELQELREEASNDGEIEELQESLGMLDDLRDEKEELEEEVEELNAEIEELEEQVEEVEDVKSMYAEELTEETPFETEELMDFSLNTLREKHEDLDTSDVTETDPDPQGSDVEEEELEEDDGPDPSDEEIEELESQLEFYERRGWSEPAANTRAELEELRGE